MRAAVSESCERFANSTASDEGADATLITRILMGMDYSALLTPLPWATFLVGIAVGAGGQYMADRFTDQRRRKEAARDERTKFDTLQARMPQFFEEMREDLAKVGYESVREFVALPSQGVLFNSDRIRFAYFETDHPHLLNHVASLVDAGYARDVSTGNFPIYRLSEEFVERISMSR